MPAAPAPDVTSLLLAWGKGDEGALDLLLPLVYSELRKIAHARMRGETPGAVTLGTTALVHEAYVRLVDGASVSWQDRTHFYAVCARLMRRILVDSARARRSAKRGGGLVAGTSADVEPAVESRDEELLALDEALERLQTADGRIADVVQLRYFGGLTVEETAQALGCSRDTVMRDWKTARLWLAHELGGLRPSGR
jgi:RNA polymerase sigma factor (TIGR02999 family)